MDEELSPCPDCGATPDIKENYMAVQGHLFSGVECPECGLAAMHFSTQQGINMWEEMSRKWTS
tara:strand:- start:983 stop:1171 length:189 start_codon:yes stop_codon:yes gene_type:complete